MYFQYFILVLTNCGFPFLSFSVLLIACVHQYQPIDPYSTSSEATKEFVKLLAVYEDIQRDLRSVGDEPCQMIRDIRSGIREVVFDKSEKHELW